MTARKTLSEICKGLPGSRGARQVNPATITRWICRGVKARDGERIRLHATRVGCKWTCTDEDLEQFFARLAADPATDSTSETSHAETARERAAARAEAKLAAAGA